MAFIKTEYEDMPDMLDDDLVGVVLAQEIELEINPKTGKVS